MLRRLASAVVLVTATLVAPAAAAPQAEKCLWGPSTAGGILSAFPQYARANVGTYNAALFWGDIAARRPTRPTDPKDGAYRWPEELDFVLSEADEAGIRVVLNVERSPAWARPAGTASSFLPRRPQDLADFLTAAAKRYPAVHHWRVWDATNFAGAMQPLTPASTGKPLNDAQKEGPRRYARTLDAAYGALKAVSLRNLVIGGNTTSVGDIVPEQFIAAMRLPDGRPPRMDLYGHAPYGDEDRPPAFGFVAPRGGGTIDFPDLPILLRWTDRNLRRAGLPAPDLWVSKWYLQSDRPGRQFGFFLTREEQAAWLQSALTQVVQHPRIDAFCWEHAFDEPGTKGGELLGGLWQADGAPKPALTAMRSVADGDQFEDADAFLETCWRLDGHVVGATRSRTTIRARIRCLDSVAPPSTRLQVAVQRRGTSRRSVLRTITLREDDARRFSVPIRLGEGDRIILVHRPTKATRLAGGPPALRETVSR